MHTLFFKHTCTHTHVCVRDELKGGADPIIPVRTLVTITRFCCGRACSPWPLYVRRAVNFPDSVHDVTVVVSFAEGPFR